MVKIKDIPGALVDKKPEPTYFPAVEGYNLAIEEIGEREIELNREKIAKIIFNKQCPLTAKYQGWHKEKSKYLYYELADAIIAAEAKILEVKK